MREPEISICFRFSLVVAAFRPLSLGYREGGGGGGGGKAICSSGIAKIETEVSIDGGDDAGVGVGGNIGTYNLSATLSKFNSSSENSNRY